MNRYQKSFAHSSRRDKIMLIRVKKEILINIKNQMDPLWKSFAHSFEGVNSLINHMTEF